MKSVKRPARPQNLVVVPSKQEIGMEMERAVAGIPSDKPPSCPTVMEFLWDLREKLDLPSDYAVAKYLGVTQKTVKTWRAGRGGFSDDMALRVEDILGEPRGYVVACMHAYRHVTNSPTQHFWEGMAASIKSAAPKVVASAKKKSRRAVASILLAACAPFIGMPDARASVNPVVSAHPPAQGRVLDTVYYVKSRRRRRRRVIDINPPPYPALAVA